MNYYQARQLKDTGKWNWTGMRDKVITTAGDCVNHPEGHNTREEAEKCFYNYQVANLREEEYESYNKCAICKKLSNKSLTTRHGSRPVTLCNRHRNKKNYMKVQPFIPGIRIISS